MTSSSQMISAYKAFAASLGPIPNPGYKTVHHPIQVPAGYLPIYVVQFNRGQRTNGEQRLSHWAIFVPTSNRRGFGNFYEIGGSLREGYRLQNVLNNRHGNWNEERGMHLAGYVAAEHLEALETRLALVPVVQGRPNWNCQTWVVEALRGLNNSQMYAIQMDYGQWYQQMELVEAAWNIGDA